MFDVKSSHFIPSAFILRRALLCLSLLAFFTPAWTGLAHAQDTDHTPKPAFETSARFAIIMDSLSGRILFAKNADKEMAPASMSKIMTMLMVFERLRDKRLSLDDEFVISENAWRKGGANSGGSTMYAELNSRIKLRDLIQGIIVQSANDGCIAVAEGIAGSEEQFAQLMTKRAHELGLNHSHFKNATGLPVAGHVSTVKELAMMARYLIEVFPEYYEIYSQRNFTWNNIHQNNRNPLLYGYPGADGIKTGYAKESGYALVGSAKRHGRRLIIVLSGLPSKLSRRTESAKVMDWGFRQFKPIDLYAPGKTIANGKVWGGTTSSVPMVSSKAVIALINDRERSKATTELVYNAPLKAPIKAGQKIGQLRIRVDGKLISEYPLNAGKSVARGDQMWRKAVDSLSYFVFGG